MVTTDALGSVRQTLDNAGTPLATASYDLCGTPQGSAISPFGFTGELQDVQGLTYLRARWYTPGAGTLHQVGGEVGGGSDPGCTFLHPVAASLRLSSPARLD